MKKYIILFIFLPVFLFADIIDEYKHQYSFLKTFKKEGFTKISIKKNQDYEFKVALRKNIKYCFITQGKNEFHIQIYNLCENDGQRRRWHINKLNKYSLYK